MSITREDVRNLETKPVTTSNVRRRINLLGVGGVGSNVARICYREQHRFALSIFDHDEVELHNLNRTSMFSVKDALTKTRKVQAIHNATSHSDAKTRKVQAIHNATSHSDMIRAKSATEVTKTSEFDIGIIIDARDTLDPSKIPEKTWLKLAYDGGSNVSFTWLPAVVADKVFDLSAGRNNTYEVVPSFYVPAALLAVLAMRFLEFPNFAEITELRAGTFHCDIDKMVDEVSYAWAPEDSFAVSDAIKEEYLASGCEAADVDHAVRRLMAECADLFEDANSAWSFLMEESHEETEGEA